MSTAAINRTELKLESSPEFPRVLSIHCHGTLFFACMFTCDVNGAWSRMIGYANTDLQSARLDLTSVRPALWFDHAAFDLSASEAELVRGAFEPLGLRVDLAEPLGHGPLEPERSFVRGKYDLDEDDQRWRSGDHRSDYEIELSNRGVGSLFR